MPSPHVIATLIFALLTGSPVGTQETPSSQPKAVLLPVIKSNRDQVSIQDGATLKKNSWTLVAEANPDIYEAQLIDGKPHKVTFVTDVESISFEVEVGKTYDFVIEKDGKRCVTRIVGVRFTPAARFDARYQAAHKNKITVEVPEVYELVNIAIALTDVGIKDEHLVRQDTPYYRKARAWFDKHRDHRLIADLNRAIAKDLTTYFMLKMNGYAFVFDRGGKIVQSPVYDRTGFQGASTNTLRPYLAGLQSFADQSDFRRFYRENKATYAEQIAFYETEANVAEMKRWLGANYPDEGSYDSYKVIFSPLVHANQSTTNFQSNGFKELQAHVNFPYPVANRFSPKGETVFRGNIVFTELNHGYMASAESKYNARIAQAVSNRAYWADDTKAAKNYPGSGLFNEYMNWALVSLRIVDYAPRDEQDKMIALVDEQMVERRGFRQFAAFDAFLVSLYRGRRPGQPVAELYPQIVGWFESHNQAGAGKDGANPSAASKAN